MRWVALLTLAGCVPISADEYARGRPAGMEGGLPSTELREDARVPVMDAAHVIVEDANADAAATDPEVVPPPPREEAGSAMAADARVPVEDAEVPVEDASAVIDSDASTSPTADAGQEPDVIGCDTTGLLCDDFESGLMCPDVAGPRWSECEHIADATGPVIEELLGGSHALRCRLNETLVSRSQRVLRMVSVDADYFEAEFWLIVDPTPNPWVSFMKLQQEAGFDLRGEPTYWPGVSLVGSNGQLKLVIESVLSLHEPILVDETDLGPLPNDWIRVKLMITWRPQFTVQVELGNYVIGGVTVSGVPDNQVTVRRQYFALGLYSQEAGAVQSLFDDVVAHAAKNGELIPLP